MQPMARKASLTSKYRRKCAERVRRTRSDPVCVQVVVLSLKRSCKCSSTALWNLCVSTCFVQRKQLLEQTVLQTSGTTGFVPERGKMSHSLNCVGVWRDENCRGPIKHDFSCRSVVTRMTLRCALAPIVCFHLRTSCSQLRLQLKYAIFEMLCSLKRESPLHFLSDFAQAQSGPLSLSTSMYDFAEIKM